MAKPIFFSSKNFPSRDFVPLESETASCCDVRLNSREATLGLTRAERRQIQNGLNRLGFEAGPADGIFGNKTRQAIRSWQQANGSQSTGYLNQSEADVLVEEGKDLASDNKNTVADSDGAFECGVNLPEWIAAVETIRKRWKEAYDKIRQTDDDQYIAQYIATRRCEDVNYWRLNIWYDKNCANWPTNNFITREESIEMTRSTISEIEDDLTGPCSKCPPDVSKYCAD